MLSLKVKLLSLIMIVHRRLEILLLRLVRKITMVLKKPRGSQWEHFLKVTMRKQLSPRSAMMYATRGICQAKASLQNNCDSVIFTNFSLSPLDISFTVTLYIKMKKPNAAIRDANAALEINPDSGKGHKARGMALAMLGQWTEAAKDLHVASSIDYDEEISAVLKKFLSMAVEPNAHKSEEHRRKYDRLHKERERGQKG